MRDPGNSCKEKMKNACLCFVLFCLSSVGLAAELKPFTTDGCSSFPDGTVEQQSLWIVCCIRHDLAYWKGGTYAQRLKADQSLHHCVAQVGEPEIAKIMLAGVRVGGSPYFPTPYRWGYGWPYPRGYKALSEDEQREVKDKFHFFETLIKSISNEIQTTDQ